jgi:alpha-beta hydrolase superfamily lysophospholipase
MITNHAADLSLPTLMQGSADRLVSVKATREFVQASPPQMVTSKVWEGGYHELHNDLIKDEVFNYMLGWLQSKID